MAAENSFKIYLLLHLFVLMFAGRSVGDTIYVDKDGPSDFNNIQAAIDAALNGDEIEAGPGTYYETIDFKGKAVRLYSSGGAEVTTIDGKRTLFENFGDGNHAGWQIIQEGTTDGPASWSSITGRMIQSSNVFDFLASTVKRGTYALCTQDFDWTDYEVSWLMMSWDDDTMGMMFRYQDPNNYYRFDWDGEGKLLRLCKMEEGVFTVLDQATCGQGEGRWCQLRIVAAGSDLRVFIVDVEGADLLRVSATDSTFDCGPIALYCWGNEGTYFDDIRVRKITTYPQVVRCVNGEGSDTVLDGFTITGGNANNALIDDFNDGDYGGWEIFDQGNTDKPSSWSASTGTMVQSSNIYAPSDPWWRGTYALSRKFFGWRDYRVDLTMKSTDDDSLGVMFRYHDRYNYYRFRWSKTEEVRRLEKMEGTTYTVLDEDPTPYTEDRLYHVTIVADGPDLEVYVDANLVLEATDDAFTYGPIALYCWGNDESHFDDISVVPLSDTRPQAYLAGGGMYNEGSSPTVANCIFTGNLAERHGGAIANIESRASLLNCIFSANQANRNGGAIWNLRSEPAITNCTFTGNVSDIGGAVSNFDSSPVIANSILWADAPDEVNDVNSTSAITYSDVAGGWPGQGNIDQYPLLRTLGKADFALSPSSPCIDSGNNSIVPSEADDIGGMSRLADGDCNNTVVVDMGAREFRHAYIGDFDATCHVDGADFALLALAWLSEPPAGNWQPLCDIGIPSDACIDARDVQVLSKNWLYDAEPYIGCDAGRMRDVFGLGVRTAAAVLRGGPCFHSPNDVAVALHDAGYGAVEAHIALREVCGVGDALDAEHILHEAGYLPEEYLESTAVEWVRKFAPILKFDRAHKGLPMSAQVYFETMMYPLPNDEDGEIYWGTHWYGPCGKPGVIVVPARDTKAYCGMYENDFSKLTNGEVPTYYKVISDVDSEVDTGPKGRLRIEYWWFYGFQTHCHTLDCTGYTGEHHGDWERILVTTDPNRLYADAVTYSFHGDWYTRQKGGFSVLEGRPIVHVGRVAHGNYHNKQYQGWGDQGSLYLHPHYCCEYSDWRDPTENTIWYTAYENLVSLRGSEPWMLADRKGATYTHNNREYEIISWRWGPHIMWEGTWCTNEHQPACSTHPTVESLDWTKSSCKEKGCTIYVWGDNCAYDVEPPESMNEGWPWD